MPKRLKLYPGEAKTLRQKDCVIVRRLINASTSVLGSGLWELHMLDWSRAKAEHDMRTPCLKVPFCHIKDKWADNPSDDTWTRVYPLTGVGDQVGRGVVVNVFATKAPEWVWEYQIETPEEAEMSGWIGVDLDGTLAVYGGWQGPDHIGDPVPLMLDRVRRWLAEGRDVRIFTARACIPEQVPPIEAWCLRHLGQVLPVTNAKDFALVELWDDRAVQVEFNTGRRVTPEVPE